MTNDEDIVTGLGSLQDRVSKLERCLEGNTSATADLVVAFNNIKGAFKVLEFVGKAAKPIAYVMGMSAVFAVWWSTFKAFLVR